LSFQLKVIIFLSQCLLLGYSPAFKQLGNRLVLAHLGVVEIVSVFLLRTSLGIAPLRAIDASLVTLGTGKDFYVWITTIASGGVKNVLDLTGLVG
jgi:hypothetical protein